MAFQSQQQACDSNRALLGEAFWNQKRLLRLRLVVFGEYNVVPDYLAKKALSLNTMFE